MNAEREAQRIRRKVIRAQLRGREAHYGFHTTLKLTPVFAAKLQPYVERFKRMNHVPYPRMLHKYVSLEKSIGRSGDWKRISKVAMQVYRCAAFHGYTNNPY